MSTHPIVPPFVEKEHVIVGAVEARLVALEEILPSDNPRRKLPPPSYIDELAASIAKHGIIEPLILRPHPKHAPRLQLVCGAMRLEGAKRAAQLHVPAVIRPYSDLDVLEIQLVENINRASMHAIDEGEAFKRLIDTKKHTPESLAKTLGKSVRWVYNRLEFTKLIPPLREAFLNDELTVTHAELLARLEPIDQKRVHNAESNARSGDGLWRVDYLDLLDPTVPAKDAKRKRSVVSVRDLENWIEDNVRLAITTTAVQALIPEIEDVQMEAARTEARVLQVATVFLLPQDPQLKKRFEGVLTDRHWKRAGGKSACEHAEKAVIVFGEGQGDVIDVCVNKKGCAKHWRDHQPDAKAKRAKKAGNDPYRKGTPAYEARVKREAAATAKENQARVRWHVFKPALERATLAAAGKLKTVSGELLRQVLATHRLPLNTKPTQLAQALLVDALRSTFQHAWVQDEKKLVAWAKRLGVNAKQVERVACAPEKGKGN